MSNWVAMANQLTRLAQRKRRLGQIVGQSKKCAHRRSALSARPDRPARCAVEGSVGAPPSS
jgi:hypothetical protein